MTRGTVELLKSIGMALLQNPGPGAVASVGLRVHLNACKRTCSCVHKRGLEAFGAKLPLM